MSSPARNPDASNPTVIEDNRIDGWTSPLGAIAYSLRGPVMVFDNQFTNGPQQQHQDQHQDQDQDRTAEAATAHFAIQPAPGINASFNYCTKCYPTGVQSAHGAWLGGRHFGRPAPRNGVCGTPSASLQMSVGVLDEMVAKDRTSLDDSVMTSRMLTSRMLATVRNSDMTS